MLGIPGNRKIHVQIGRCRSPQGAVHGKTVLGQFQRGSDHLGKAARSKALQHGNKGVRGRTRPGGQGSAAWNEAHALLLKPFKPCRFGRNGIAVNREDFFVRRAVSERGQFAPEGMHMGVEHAFGQRRGNGRIKGVAPGTENVHTGFGGQIVFGRNHPARAHQGRAIGHRVLLV